MRVFPLWVLVSRALDLLRGQTATENRSSGYVPGWRCKARVSRLPCRRLWRPRGGGVSVDLGVRHTEGTASVLGPQVAHRGERRQRIAVYQTSTPLPWEPCWQPVSRGARAVRAISDGKRRAEPAVQGFSEATRPGGGCDCHCSLEMTISTDRHLWILVSVILLGVRPPGFGACWVRHWLQSCAGASSRS